MIRISRASILPLVPFVMIVGCSRPPTTEPTGEPGPAAKIPADELRWLLGAWTTDATEDTVTVERWRAGANGALVGRSDSRRGEEITQQERIRIEERAGALVFIASPSSQATTEFVGSSTCAPDGDECPRRCEAVFDNPDHDFPKRITYRRCLERDELVATISGADDQRQATWTYRLVDGSANPKQASDGRR